MSNSGNGQPRRYKVEMSGQTRTQLKQLHAQTRAAGKRKRFLAAVRQIVKGLQIEPLQLGEPLYRLPALHLIVCQAVVDFVVVDCAIHEDLPLVFFRGSKTLK
jgi:hypothetical protein